jgi:phospholipid/cholesterol/gamma-HCH transport system substrate-binding protein
VRRAVREHLRDFVAIAILLVLGLATTGVILAQQSANLPSWVPFLGQSHFELKAELSSAQAVTPGQGQTVNIAGIKVGQVSSVDLESGTAVVTMQVDEKYAPLIHPDASILLRPRTGLQDMTLELDTGTRGGEIHEGSTVPLADTQSNVEPDEVLASLDADTRSYLQLLLQGAGKGLAGHGRELSAGLRRFEPTARDLARIGGALAKRRQNIRRVITNFGRLSSELGRSDTQLAGFVRSSNDVLGSFARQEASIRATLRQLPPTLHTTRGALASSDRLSAQLGPASTRLIPAAKALGPALRNTRPLFRRTVGPIRHQIRPFARAVQKPLRHVKQATGPLGRTVQGLAGSFDNLNLLFNALAYNPPGSAEEGYLFWLAWLNHDTNALFFTQDAGGPLRHGQVLLTCSTAFLADIAAASDPFLKTLQQLTNVPTRDEIANADPNDDCEPIPTFP